MGKATRGTTTRKHTRQLSGKNRLVRESGAASKINFRERMIMAISEIGRVSLPPLIILVIF